MFLMDCDGLSHLGTSKRVNEDRFVIAEVRAMTSFQKMNLDLDANAIRYGRVFGNYLFVSDGNGEPDDAARASTLVIDNLVKGLMDDFHWTAPFDSRSEKAITDQVRNAFWTCQDAVVREARVLDSSHHADMSASLALAWIAWPHLMLATAGNCRILLVRNGKLKFCTHDDSKPMAETKVQFRTGSEPLDDSKQNVLTNIVGGRDNQLSPTIHFIQLELNDAIALCTDGVTHSLSNRRLTEILASDLTAAEACQVIVDDSLRIDGSDNITAVVAKLKAIKPEPLTMEQFAETANTNRDVVSFFSAERLEPATMLPPEPL